MKRYLSLLATLTMGVSALPMANINLNTNFINLQKKNEIQKLTLVNLDSFNNLFKNIITMTENNIFWDSDVKFDHWVDGDSEDVLEIFAGTIADIYETYFNDQKLALTQLTERLVSEGEVKNFSANFKNNSVNEQEWLTPGYTKTVTNHYSYTTSISNSDSIGASASVSVNVSWVGADAETHYEKTIESGETTEVSDDIEETVQYPPQPVVVSPKSFGVATYRIIQGKYEYTGSLTTINPKPIKITVPKFIDKKGEEVKIVLTASDLLEGLSDAGYNMDELGLTSTKYSIFTYDSTKDIEDITGLSFNLPTEWSAEGAHIDFDYTETPLP